VCVCVCVCLCVCCPFLLARLLFCLVVVLSSCPCCLLPLFSSDLAWPTCVNFVFCFWRVRPAIAHLKLTRFTALHTYLASLVCCLSSRCLSFSLSSLIFCVLHDYVGRRVKVFIRTCRSDHLNSCFFKNTLKSYGYLVVYEVHRTRSRA
jgi:hypothetical protein